MLICLCDLSEKWVSLRENFEFHNQAPLEEEKEKLQVRAMEDEDVME